MKVKHLLYFSVLLASVALAEGPVFHHKDPVIQKEFEETYQELRNIRGQFKGQALNLVRDFGAKGDGSTDDRDSLQAGVNKCSELQTSLYIPPGTYIVKSAVIAKSNCVIFGENKYVSTLMLPQHNINPMNYSLFMTTSTEELHNFSIQHLGFIGNRSYQTTSFTNSSQDGMAVAITSSPVNNLSFDDLFISSFGAVGTARNTGGGGILIVPAAGLASGYGYNIRCTRCVFDNNDKISGFYLDLAETTNGGGRNIAIMDNSFKGGYHNNTVYVLGGYGSSAKNRVYNVTINRNHFYNTEDSDSNIEVNGVYNFSIDENQFVYNQNGLAYTALVRSDVSNGSISHNNVFSSSTDTEKPGISLVAFSDGEHQDNIVIDGNTFFVSTATANLLKVVKGSRRIRIKNNIFISTQTAIDNAITIGEASDVDVSGNHFQNIVKPIVLSGGTFPSTTDIFIHDNIFTGCGASGASHIATTGGTIALTFTRVEGNTVISPNSTSGGAAFCALSVSANTGNVLRNNIVYGGLSVTDADAEWSLIWNNVGYDRLVNSNVARSGPHSMAANTPTSIATVTVSAGDYLITGACGWRTGATTKEFYCAINTTPNSLGGGDSFSNFGSGKGIIANNFSTGIGSANDWGIPLPASRFTATSSTSLYLISQSDQANNAFGFLTAVPIGTH